MEVCSKMLNLFILMSLLLNKNNFIESYSQVSRVGASSTSTTNNNNTNSEIIIHNPGREGVFSSDNDGNNKTMSEYNDDGELTTIENKSTEVFTGRSSQMGGFQIPFSFNTKPISYRRPSMAKSDYNRNEKSFSSSSSPTYVYPSYGSKSIDETYKYSSNLPSPSTAVAMDRFSPGEAYGFQQHLKNKNKNGYDYSPPKSQLPDKAAISQATPPPPTATQPPVLPTPSSSPPRPVYQPPKDLYAFPPNIGSNYLPPYMKQSQRPVTSYLPPAAGLPDNFDPNSFVGPVNPKYLPSSNSQSMPPSMSAQSMAQDMPPQNMPPGMMMSDSGSMNMDNPPSNEDNHNHDHSHDHSHDHPPSTGMEVDYHDHHNHEHSHDMPPAMMSNTPPPPPAPTTENPLTQMMVMVMEALKNNKNNNSPPPPPPPPTSDDISFASPSDHDHDHDFHYHDHDHDYHGQHGVDVYPEVIYDHDPHDHHHDIVITTTPAPPPEEHMESRVKKYSYYYLGRKLWYIPLYFTVYFSFYVAALIIRSIGRHKVQWPNHYQKRSIDSGNISHKETVRKVEKLTNFVMGSIDDFTQKYF